MELPPKMTASYSQHLYPMLVNQGSQHRLLQGPLEYLSAAGLQASLCLDALPRWVLELHQLGCEVIYVEYRKNYGFLYIDLVYWGLSKFFLTSGSFSVSFLGFCRNTIIFSINNEFYLFHFNLYTFISFSYPLYLLKPPGKC